MIFSAVHIWQAFVILYECTGILSEKYINCIAVFAMHELLHLRNLFINMNSNLFFCDY